MRIPSSSSPGVCKTPSPKPEAAAANGLGTYDAVGEAGADGLREGIGDIGEWNETLVLEIISAWVGMVPFVNSSHLLSIS